METLSTTFIFCFTIQRIDLYAVKQLLGILQPSFAEWSEDKCRNWLCAIHNCQNIIDATIFAVVKRQGSPDNIKEIRYSCIQLLHVVFK